MSNARVLERLRAQHDDKASVHATRLSQLENQFAALKGLAGRVKIGESLADAVARANAELDATPSISARAPSSTPKPPNNKLDKSGVAGVAGVRGLAPTRKVVPDLFHIAQK